MEVAGGGGVKEGGLGTKTKTSFQCNTCVV